MYSVVLKALRVALVALLLLGITAITWNFLSRREAPTPVLQEQFLSSEIKQRTTQFEYTEHKEGRPLFKVRAQMSTETLGGLHQLSEIRLIHYDDQGQPAERVSGREATYKIQERQVDILGDVKILLVDGTEILSNRVRANLERETIAIDEGFRIRRKLISGEGRSLLYQIPQKAVRIADQFRLTIPQGARQAVMHSDRVHYDVANQLMDCSGNASIRDGQRLLLAQRIVIYLTQEEGIDKVLASGQASLTVSPGQEFAGDRIHAFFDQETGRLRQFRVLGSPLADGGVGVPRATYKEASHHLEGDRIEVLPSPGAGPLTGSGFEHLTAYGEVRFSSSSLGIKKSRADVFVLKPLGQKQRQLDLTGNVSLVRHPDTGVEERVSSERLVVQFQAEGNLDHALASGKTTVELRGSEGERRLDAEDSVEVFYRGGGLERIVAKKNAVLKQSRKDEKSKLQSSEMKAWFEPDGLRKIVAHGGVHWSRRLAEKESSSSSDDLILDYQEGRIVEVVQSGNFYYEDKTDSGSMILESERATFREQTQVVEVQGQKQPILRYFGADPDQSTAGDSTTKADRIEISRATGAIAALGRVSTIFENAGGESAALVSGRLELDPKSGWLTYSGHPRLVQNRNLISGRLIRFNQSEGMLEVEGEVESILVDEKAPQETTYQINSKHLLYDRSHRRATYKGKVQLTTDDLSMESPLLDLHFASSSLEALQRAVASGGVQLRERQRHGQGEKAVYDLQQQRLELTGNMAQIRDPKEGKFSGHKFTFYVGTDMLSIESSTPSSAP